MPPRDGFAPHVARDLLSLAKCAYLIRRRPQLFGRYPNWINRHGFAAGRRKVSTKTHSMDRAVRDMQISAAQLDQPMLRKIANELVQFRR